MANLKDLNKAVRKAKKKPAPKVNVVKDATEAIVESNKGMNDAVLEILKDISPTVNVSIDEERIGKVLGREIAKIDFPQPIINIPERKPVSYKAQFDLNSRGDMIAARIDPVE